MNLLYFLPLAALWGGLWWRLRGGAFTTITGFDPGTGGMRAIAAVALVGPLGLLNPWFLVLVPAFWIAWSLAGWGAFQGMGHETSVEQSNEVAFLLSKVFTSLVVIDVIGMAIEGVYTMSIPLLTLDVLEYLKPETLDPVTPFLLPIAGLLFAPLYYLAQRVITPPDWGRFAKAGSEWGEVFVGAVVGASVFTAVVS